MSHTHFKPALLAALLALYGAGARAQDGGFTPYIEGRVARVIDGNTLVVDNQTTGRPVRVLLRGTDAPEMRQPFGAESRQRLESLVAGAQVRVEFKFVDQFGQVVGLVLKENEDINFRQLSEGAAWFRTGRTNELSAADRKEYEAAAAEARAARKGLWKERAPTAPWDFRRANNISEDPRDETLLPAPAPAPAPIVRANSRTKIYFIPGCPGHDRVPARLRVRFKTSNEAERAGYKPAPGCTP